MIRALIRFLASAAAFQFLLPMIPGIDFHGNFAVALGAALVFSIVGWFVDLAAMALSAILTVSSFGMALLWLIPLWIVGFWILPAVTLSVVAHLMPTHLTVNGWFPAAMGGLVMLILGALTSKPKKQD